MAQGFLRCVQWAPGTKSLVCGFYPNTGSPAQVRVRGRVPTAGQHLGESKPWRWGGKARLEPGLRG